MAGTNGHDIVQIGDIVLIKTTTETTLWGDCLLVVEEVRSWGVIGVVPGPGKAIYPLRLAHGDIAAIYRRR
jgi:hypothetical protein